MRTTIKGVEWFLTFRPLSWVFRRNWYSLYRWKNPTEFEGRVFKAIDLGFVTFGCYLKKG